MKTQETVRCAFTASEVCHILSLIACNERNGEHTAPQDQYWKRSERIKAKLRSSDQGRASGLLACPNCGTQPETRGWQTYCPTCQIEAPTGDVPAECEANWNKMIADDRTERQPTKTYE